MIKAIMACDDQGGIARNGLLPWPKNSEDLQHFKKLTSGDNVVMGYTTWAAEDMPKPLPGRLNVVVTSDCSKVDGAARCISVGNIQKEIIELDLATEKDTWIIGGAGLLAQVLDIVETFHLSRIHGSYDCDTFISLDDIHNKFSLQEGNVIDGVTFEIWRRNA